MWYGVPRCFIRSLASCTTQNSGGCGVKIVQSYMGRKNRTVFGKSKKAVPFFVSCCAVVGRSKRERGAQNRASSKPLSRVRTAAYLDNRWYLPGEKGGAKSFGSGDWKVRKGPLNTELTTNVSPEVPGQGDRKSDS